VLLPFDTIARSLDFDERARAMQLRPWQWEFLLAADGRTRLGELASRCGIDLTTAAQLVHEAEALGLVEIVTLSLSSYRAAPALEGEPPLAIAAARKAVSVSFDARSTILASWAPPTPDTNVAPDGTEPDAATNHEVPAAPVTRLLAADTPRASDEPATPPAVSAPAPVHENTPGFEAASNVRSDPVFTGVVLRALGLKK